jgi:ribosomal protein S27AE
VSGALHVHAPAADAFRRQRRRCPTCQARRTFTATHQAWYGWLLTCLGCGDRWQDGERLPRPFARGWRQQEIAAARKRARALAAAGLPARAPIPARTVA